MLNIDISKLEAAVKQLEGSLKGGLMTADVWVADSGLSLVESITDPGDIALLNDIITNMSSTLGSVGFPTVDRFVTIDLTATEMIVIARVGDDSLRAAALIDKTKTNLGIILNIALPQFISALEQADS